MRVRLLEMFEREGKDFVTGLFRKMLVEAEEGARRRLRSWPDGTYRCVTFSDAAGLQRGLLRNCAMTMTKTGDEVHIDFTGTSPESPSSYNAHPQAVIGHLANYIYEYVFHDLPISSATFQPFSFTFPPNSMLCPDARAATSNSVMAATGAMSAIANCVSRARYGTTEWHQVTAAPGNGGNASVVAGVSQWGMPFADMIAYPINTEGQGARSHSDGMNAYGFPWCAFGRAPDVETMENEFPLLIPFSQHWEDSGGAGKHRGGVGTAQLWVAHHVPWVVFMSIADNSIVQTPQPLFGGYTMCTCPGLGLEGADIPELLRAGQEGRLDLASLLAGQVRRPDRLRALRPLHPSGARRPGAHPGPVHRRRRARRPDRPGSGRGGTGSHRRHDLRAHRHVYLRRRARRADRPGEQRGDPVAPGRDPAGPDRARQALRGVRCRVVAAQAAGGRAEALRLMARRRGDRAADAAMTLLRVTVPVTGRAQGPAVMADPAGVTGAR